MMLFEVAGTTYALPISEVLEVVEQRGTCCVPTLPKDRGCVMNWHGEALPVVAPHLLLGGAPIVERDEEGLQSFLVVSDRPDAGAQLGLPVDGVCGLVDGEVGRALGDDVVVEQRPLDGRLVNLINPQRLVARAEEVIAGASPSGAVSNERRSQ